MACQQFMELPSSSSHWSPMGYSTSSVNVSTWEPRIVSDHTLPHCDGDPNPPMGSDSMVHIHLDCCVNVGTDSICSHSAIL